MDKKNIQNIYELTPMQNAILVNDLLSNAGAFFEQLSFSIHSKLDIAIFEQVWNTIILRHDLLRTNFIHNKAKEPLQIVFKQRPLEFYYEELSSKASLESYKMQDKQRGFNLAKDKLFRIALFKESNQLYHVIISFHHILMDGWCSTILYDEFRALYLATIEKQSLTLPTATPYVEYVKWLRKMDEEGQKAFWSTYLEGYSQLATLPHKKSSQLQKIKEFSFNFSQELSTSLKSLAQELKVTLNVVLQSLWGILLSRYNDTHDVVFGTIVSGRPTDIAQIDTMVGLFMNTIALRVKYEKQTNFKELVEQMQQTLLGFKSNEYYPLAKIQTLTPLKNGLIDHSFVFENFPADEGEDGRLKVSDYTMDDFSGDDFTLQVMPHEDAIYFKLIYNQAIFDQKVVENIQNDLTLLAQELRSDSIVTNLAQELGKKYQKERIKTVITATFTTDNIEENLKIWGKKFGLELDTHFSGYNQVFQELIDETSQTSQNTTGVNIFLVRLEDFIRSKSLGDQEAIVMMEKSYLSLLEILRSKKRESDYFFGIFPPSTHLGLSQKLIHAIEWLNSKFMQELKALKNVYPIDFRNIAQRYQVDEIFDPLKDKAGHLPFSDAFYTAYATEIYRAIYALKKPHFKVIALDCDNTLWGGVVGEDGVFGIDISGGYLELQKFVIAKQAEGFLIVLNSKNNENDVWEVFEKNEKMLLKKEHIVHAKINWQPKSQNLKEMAQELNLGLNSFIFLDDNPLEASEVIKNAPEVLSIPLPKNPNTFKLFLEHIWAMDKLKITAEDKSRTQMYKAETQRNESSQKLSMDDFLASLELKIYMNRMFDSQLPRVAQLTQRTNQFNVSTIRRSESDISTLLKDDNFVCWSVNVEDKFGDYGLVGVIMTQKQEEILFIDTFLMSCRVLGRGVEKTILSGLKNYAKSYGISKLEIDFYPTKKNRPALDFIQNSGFILDKEEAEKRRYYQMVEELPEQASFVEFLFDREESVFTTQTVQEVLTPTQTALKEEPIQTTQSSIDDFNFAFLESLDAIDREAIVHPSFYEPLLHHKATQILGLSQSVDQRKALVEFIAPQTPDEIALSAIYQELLHIEKVGIHDCFFELGGHSLSATRLLSRIYQQFRVELELKDIFSHPTIAKLFGLMGESKESVEHIPKAPSMPSYPLSHAQKRVWLIDQMGGGIAYSMPIAMELQGAVDSSKLEAAFYQLIVRHEILRTGFIVEQGEPRQKIYDTLEVKIEPIKCDASSAREMIRTDMQQAFDLNQMPLFRIKLFSIDANRSILYFNMHHIISDGGSLGVITQELSLLYQDKVLEPLTIQYKDFSLWQDEYLNSQAIKKDKAYWLNQFKEELEPLHFPSDFPRFKQQSFRGNTLPLDLSSYLTSIESFNQQYKSTLFMFVTALIKVILARYTLQEDSVLGFPISGREKMELENQIGFYANTLALRNKINFDSSFEAFIQELKTSILEAHAHQNYPFEKLVDELNIKRDLSHSPIFDYTIALNNDEEPFSLGDIKVKALDIDFKMAQFDMSFNFFHSKELLALHLNYNSDLFSEESMQRFLKHINNLFASILKHPKQEIKELAFLTPTELQQDIRTTAINKSSLVERFAKQCQRTPHANALNYYDTNLSYRELDRASNQVAWYLIEALKVQQEDIVSILLPRTHLSVIAMLGILKASATFLPLNIALPTERIEYILNDARSKALLDEASILKALNYPKEEALAMDTPSDSSAYIIYTSGTTGQPKGVEVLHSSLINLCEWYIQDMKIDTDTKSLLMIPTSFDASIKNILAPLFVGGEVVVAQEQFDAYDLADLIEQKGVTLINCVPNAFKAILDAVENFTALQSLKCVALGAEKLNIASFKDFYLQSSCELFNLYGPTEACDITTIYRVTDKDLERENMPIGHEIFNAKVYILDAFGNLLPTNAVGELYIAGEGVAKGYLNHQELTNQSFILHPKLGRLYKSGDLARRVSSGNIEFMGRSDDQVKINGNRIELGEIEKKMMEYEGINWVWVLLREDRLVGYYKAAQTLESSLIRGHLKSRLPSYMIPAEYIQIQEIPLTQNGKIDKKALLAMRVERVKKDERALSAFEQEIVKIFQEVLGSELSINDNFFEVGGDSLKALRVMAKINEKYAKKLQLSSLFEYQQIEEFASYLQNDQEEKSLYKVFNPDKHKALFIFPALIDALDYKTTPAKLAPYLSEYKLYALDFIEDENRWEEYAKLIGSLEEEFSFLGYSSGGNIAFEVSKRLDKQPKVLILIDSWKIEALYSLKAEDVYEEFRNNHLTIDHTIVNKYINMINLNTNSDKINADIELIRSERDEVGDDSLSQEWHSSTTKAMHKTQGFGNHLEMLKEPYLRDNALLINQILRRRDEI